MAVALRSRNIIEAFQQPTVAMAVKDIGERDVLIQLTAATTMAMRDYFSEEHRMDPAMCSSFAEAVMEKYPHEAIGDIPVFIKYAGWARYGERKEDGTVVNKGKTYGRLTLTTLMGWWEQYLDEKAEELEKARRKELKALNAHDPDGSSPIVAKAVLDVMKKAHAEALDPGEREKDLDTGKRIDRLVRLLPHMGRDRMRYEYNKATTKREQRFIYSVAVERGYVAQYIEEHLNKPTTNE